MDNQKVQTRGIRTLVPAIATGAMVLSGSAMAAEGDADLASLGTGAIATIKSASPTLIMVGLAVIGVAATIYVILRVKGMIR